MSEQIPAKIAELAELNARQLRRLEESNAAALRGRLRAVVSDLQEQIESLPPGSYARGRAAVIQLLAAAAANQSADTLKDLLRASGALSRDMAWEHLEPEINAWLEHHGQDARPLNIAAAAQAEASTVIERYPRSIEAYGQAVAAQVQGALSSTILSQASSARTVELIQRALDSETWRAERIVRTETHAAYNAAHLEGLRRVRDEGTIPNLRKSALVTFDRRTAADSLPMQGQVRELEDFFSDGAGRRFLHPPGRPNDREKEIPWIDDEDLVLRDVDAAAEFEQQRRELQREQAAAARLSTFEGRRERLVLGWTTSSHNRVSAEIKEALKDLGVAGMPYQRREYSLDPDRVTQTRADLRRIYDDTQAHFAERGITHVRLYRGYKSDYDIASNIEAWSSDEKTARKFGRLGVMYDDVPVSRILWHHDGPGWTNGPYGQQYEYLVLSSAPRNAWRRSDFEIGFFRASEFDGDAELDERGYWGVTAHKDGDATLWHVPSQRALVSGPYTREQLKILADELEQGGYVQAGGKLADDERLDSIKALAARSAQDRALLDYYGRLDRELAWSERDFEIGFFDASEIDPEPLTAGAWGIVEYRPTEDDPAGGASLYHRPTGAQVLTGVYTKEDLKAVAARLDGLLDERGRLPGDDDPRIADLEGELDFAREYFERRRVNGWPAYNADNKPPRWVDLGGAEWPAINDDVAPNAKGRWSRRTFKVANRALDGSLAIESVDGHVQGSFAVYKTTSNFTSANGYSVNDWHLVHLPTGLEIHQGVSMPITDGGGQRGYQVGNWRAGEFQSRAERLQAYLNPDGSVKKELAEDWLLEIEALQRQSYPGQDVRSWLGDEYQREDWIHSPISLELPSRLLEENDRVSAADSMSWLLDGPDLEDEIDFEPRAKVEPRADDDEVPF